MGQNCPTFRPPFSEILSSIELKIFLQILDTIWGGYFFWFPYIFCPSNKKAKILDIPWKTLVFLLLQILKKLSKFTKAIFSEIKKITHPKYSLVYVKKFSARYLLPCRRYGGETVVFLQKTWFWEKHKTKFYFDFFSNTHRFFLFYADR